MDSYSTHGMDLRAAHYWHQFLCRHASYLIIERSDFLVLDGRNGEVVHIGSAYF